MKRPLTLILSFLILCSCSFNNGNTNSNVENLSIETTSSIGNSSAEESSLEETMISSSEDEEDFSSEDITDTSGKEEISSEEISSEISEIITNIESTEKETSSEYFSSGISGFSSEIPAEPNYITLNNDIKLKDVLDTQNYGTTPSVGDVNVLVIPILFTNYSFELEDIRQSLDDTFNGENLDYFYSVKKYYELSSYGNLNFNFEIAPIFEAGLSTLAIKQTNNVHSLMERAYDSYYVNHLDEMSKFDLDKDGYADGVWFIYGCPTYYSSRDLSSEFWAYTTHFMAPKRSNKIELNTVGWASYKFMNEGKNSNWQDAHTFIHETGHMLGLDDYYCYDEAISPLGKIDMMDNNVCDHNAWSKFALGWIKPKLMVKNGTIDLNVFQEDGDAIFISLEKTKCKNPFGEFLILEYYTPERLNKLDSTIPYNYLKGPNKGGLKVIHVDARVIEGSYALNYSKEKYLQVNFDDKTPYLIAHSNSKSRSFFESQYCFISMIDANGRIFYDSYETFDEYTLWNEGDVLDFDDEILQAQFVNLNISNSEWYLPYQIHILEENTESLTLEIFL